MYSKVNLREREREMTACWVYRSTSDSVNVHAGGIEVLVTSIGNCWRLTVQQNFSTYLISLIHILHSQRTNTVFIKVGTVSVYLVLITRGKRLLKSIS